MKKWTVLMTVVCLVLAMSGAQAAVQSITTFDTTQVISMSGAAALEDPFRIFPVESPTAIQQEIQRMFDFVNAQTGEEPPVRFFAETEQALVQAELPDTLEADTLLVNEILSLGIVNYDEKYGDVSVEFAFATVYEPGKFVTILLGITNADVNTEWDENTDWNTNTLWVALKAEALDNGHLRVTFPQDALVKMMSASAITMIIFNQP